VIPSWYTEAIVVLDPDGRSRPLLAEEQAAEVRVGADGFCPVYTRQPASSEPRRCGVSLGKGLSPHGARYVRSQAGPGTSGRGCP